MILACVTALGMSGIGSVARADAPTEQQLQDMFSWVDSESTAAVAIAMTDGVPDPQSQMAMQDWILLTLWVKGGDPWKISPDWVPPVGP